MRDFDFQDYFFERFERDKEAPGQKLLGTEYEFFILQPTLSTPRYRPLPMDGEPGVYQLISLVHDLAQSEERYWKKQYENDKLIGLSSEQKQTITIEPGGQIEFSGAPLNSLPTIHEELTAYLRLLSGAVAQFEGRILALGLMPFCPLDEIPLVDKQRYHIMFPYMKQVGTHGQMMMKATAGTQISLDYFSKEDLECKFVFLNRLSPFLTAIFANSPFYDGKPTGFCSFRGRIWLDTDPDRAGLPTPFLEESFQLEHYIEWACKASPYFLKREDQIIVLTHLSFNQLLAGKHAPIQITAEDWKQHLGMVFPDIRIKQIIEVRSMDALMPQDSIAVPALLKALIYNESAFDAIYSLLMDLKPEHYLLYRQAGAQEGVQAEVGEVSFLKIARQIFETALSALGSEEEQWLLPYFEKYTKDGKTPADLVLENFTKAQQDLEQWAQGYFLESFPSLPSS